MKRRIADIAAHLIRITAVVLLAPLFLAGGCAALCVSAFLAGWREMRS